MSALLFRLIAATLAAIELWVIIIIHDAYWNLPLA